MMCDSPQHTQHLLHPQSQAAYHPTQASSSSSSLFRHIMQFQPRDMGPQVERVDITFCNYLEQDPEEWTAAYHNVIEEYVTCFARAQLAAQSPDRDRILYLLNVLGRTYNILPDLYALVQAALPPPQAGGPNTALHGVPIDQIFPALPFPLDHPDTPKCIMANLRKIALEALQNEQHASYPLKKALWLQSYERIKHVFENKVIKILNPPLFLCITQSLSRHTSYVANIQDRSPEQLNHMYRDLYYVTHSDEGGLQRHPFLPRWLMDDSKRSYEFCVFDPKGTIPYNYNTYVGMRAANLPPVVNVDAANEAVQLIIRHIREVFCNDNEGHTQYVLRWLANIIKYPWKKTEVLILLFGVEGCGKTMIIDFFGNMILGSHLSFQTASPGVDIFGKFAVGTHRKLLTFIDEAGEELSKNHDMLKNLITTATLRVEKKCKDIIVEDNYTNLIVASNNTTPIKVSSSDRRMVAFQCSDRYKDNVEYFATLSMTLRNDENARAFYDYLMQMDLDEDFPFQAHRPLTRYYESLMASSLSIFWRFLSYKCLTQGSDGGGRVEPARVLFTEFDNWKKERGYDIPYTEVRFGKELNELVNSEGSGITRIKRSTIQYELKFDLLRRYLIKKKRFDENAF